MNLRIGLLSPKLAQSLANGYSRCLRCKTPWNFVEYHQTMYTYHDGCFPLCEMCWGELTPQQRLPYYRELIDIWYEPPHENDEPGFDETWAAVETAVMEGR